jgi:hypothetical protein
MIVAGATTVKMRLPAALGHVVWWQYIASRSAFKQEFGYPELAADGNVNGWAHG